MSSSSPRQFLRAQTAEAIPLSTEALNFAESVPLTD